MTNQTRTTPAQVLADVFGDALALDPDWARKPIDWQFAVDYLERRGFYIVTPESLATLMHENFVNCMQPVEMSRILCGPTGRAFEDMHLISARMMLGADR